MKKATLILFIVVGSLCHAQMVNPGFEQSAAGAYTSATAVSGWTVESRSANSTCTYTNWTQGSPEFSILATPFNNYPFTGSPVGIIGHSPLGGSMVVRLNDSISNNQMTRIRQTFTVSSATALLQYAFAGYWQDGGSGHGCCDQPGVSLKLYDQTGMPLVCHSMSLFPGSGCQSTGTTFTLHANLASWTNWQARAVDLSPFIGQKITVEFMTTDCSFGTHFGSTLVDICASNRLLFTPLTLSWLPFSPTPVACTLYLCPGNNYAYLNAPIGYASYQWSGPTGTIAAPQGTSSTLVLPSPTLGDVYTVTLQSYYGCTYPMTFTITNSQVSIWDLTSSGTCPNSTNGSATVIPTGSTHGYNFQWTNSSNSVIATTSVISELSPGIYSLTVSSTAGCGTAVATVTISTKTPTLQILAQPYCGGIAYLNAPSGTNYQWYNYNTPISGTTGIAPSLTVTTAASGMKYRLAFDSPLGCRDSLEFVLLETIPGSMVIPSQSITPTCVSAATGSAAIRINPAFLNQQTSYAFNVSSTGTMAAFSSSLASTSISIHPVTGLAAGIYTVNGSDGFCAYTTTFAVGAVQFSSSLSTLGATVCPGGKATVSINISPTPANNQYKIQWFPSSAIQATANAAMHATLSPSAAPAGSIYSQVYTVVITPSIAACPETKTLTLTRANPTVALISTIQPLCTSFPGIQIQVAPLNGTFSNEMLTPTLIDSSGFLHPANAKPGINSFTYAVNISTCVAATSITFSVSKFYSAQLFAPQITLCENSPPTLLNVLAQNDTSATWQGLATQGSTFFPAIAGVGTFTILHHTASVPNSATCPDSASLQIHVQSAPVVAASSGSVCAGSVYTIKATGASSFIYSSGSSNVIPSTTTSYSVWGISQVGCKSNSPAVISVSVKPTPTLTVNSSNPSLCSGEQVTLTVSGASSYSWSEGTLTSTLFANPPYSQIFTVWGTDGECEGSTYYFQNVLNCTAIDAPDGSGVKIYPNPARGFIYITLPDPVPGTILLIVDITGNAVLSTGINKQNEVLQVSHLKAGVYLVIVQNGTRTFVRQKLVID